MEEVSGTEWRADAEGVSLKLKGKVYATCVRSAMIYGSETWVLNVEQQRRLERVEM